MVVGRGVRGVCTTNATVNDAAAVAAAVVWKNVACW
jgi:hypothetical protein